MTEKRKGLFYRIYIGMNSSKLLLCIRSSLIMLIPVLFIGSMALMLKSFPIDAYQNFIGSFLNGVIANFFSLVYSATFGILSIYVSISISICYTQQIGKDNRHTLGPMIASLVAFFIISGTFDNGALHTESLGAAGMFTAVIGSLFASWFYDILSKKMKRSMRLFTEGDDEVFRNTLFALAPTAIVAIVAAVINSVSMLIFDGNNIHMAFSSGIGFIFKDLGRNLGSVLLFEFVAQFLWFLGIHGNNVLEPVCQDLFTPAMDINQQLVEQGMAATEIHSKTFLDVFINMGGSGSVMCLLIAIMVFSQRRSNRKLGMMAAIPGFFNISEIITFGLPIVFNPIFIIPYLLVPMVMGITSTLAVEIGLVPVAINHVEWTTPILWSGYLATDSVAGCILQIVNLVIGTLIYAPFVKIFDKEMIKDANRKMDQLVDLLKKSEETREVVRVLSLRDVGGMVARHLAEDLQTQLIDRRPNMYYQPQYNSKGECIGAEALLRWRHSIYDMIYPPLVIQVAEESGKLIELEKNIFVTIMESMPKLIEVLGEETKISVNVTGTTIQSEEFEQFLVQLSKDYPRYSNRVVIEITEQAALSIKEELIDRLTRIAKRGYGFAIDDFSMGSTSIKYLQTNVFNLIKLDGSMTRVILKNRRSKDIIASITKLSSDLGIDVLAEYVETEEQRAALEEVGCYLYQGYLYSPAVPMDKLQVVKNKK
ncbi:MAG: PTS sugar transporter subunit IIC/EAL domain-containing protein [Lachnospiraceae bacterium]|nr:PTS sugar transporter subunit IIC/EAL domain-containing protein [Lachnospiraceae bacterium]